MLEITEEQQAKLEALVASGAAASVEEALDAAIHALSQPDLMPLSDEQIAEARRRAEMAAQGIGVNTYETKEAFRAAILEKSGLAELIEVKAE